MTEIECENLNKAAQLLNAVPPLRGVVTDTLAYRTASQDYEYVIGKIAFYIMQYCTYARWSRKLGTGEVDDDFIKECKKNADELLKEVEEFVARRKKEGWD